MPGSADDARAAERIVWLALFSWMAVVAGLGVATIAHRDEPASRLQPSNADNPVSDTAIGPAAGAEVEGYRTARRSVLATASGDDRVAVVSFTSYRSEAAARQVLSETANGAGLQVAALLVATPGDGPALVTGSLADWATAERSSLQQQHDDIAQILPTVGPDKAYADFYTAELDRLTKALAGLDPAGDLVFGVVVRGPVETLQALGDRAPVRLVDIGTSGTVSDDPLAYRGILPDDVTVVTKPQLRPLPPG
ncbi:MAG: hypothetical protein QOE63_167 [Acidimicrobiaceae bacterium]